MKPWFGCVAVIWSFFTISLNVDVTIIATKNLIRNAFRVIRFTFNMRRPSEFVMHYDYVLFANNHIIRINDLTCKPQFLLMGISCKHNFLKSLGDWEIQRTCLRDTELNLISVTRQIIVKNVSDFESKHPTIFTYFTFLSFKLLSIFRDAIS